LRNIFGRLVSTFCGPACLIVALALLTTVAEGQIAPSAQARLRGIAPARGMRGAKPNAAAAMSPAAASNPLNMLYNGGAVQPDSNIYAFWWGMPSDFPPDARAGLDSFLQGLDGTNYLDIADEYMFGVDAHTHFGGDLFDYSAPPLEPVDLTTFSFINVASEICGVLKANGQKPDPLGLYVVYSSNYPIQNYYCAIHGPDTCADGTVLNVAYVPNLTTQPTCSSNFEPLITPNRQSEPTRAMASASAHEIMEAITDPNLDAWYSPVTGDEVADPCSYEFQTQVPLTNGRWKLQEIWSNAAGGCVQGASHSARVVGDVSSVGAIKTFDISTAAFGTFGESINLFGASVGFYTDISQASHGFLRDALGNVITIDPPGTGYFVFGGAQAFSINAEGTTTGNWADVNYAYHGFVRDNKGNYVTFDPPGSTFTAPTSINNYGVIAGNFGDTNSVNHGFLRDSEGNFVTINAPGAANVPYAGTAVLSINANGAVTGNSVDADFLSHGFVRHADGTMVSFDVAGASQGTFAEGINLFGTVAGYYIDAEYVSHGFVRDALGKITTFDAPNSAAGGTFALSINAVGAVAGYYSDANGFSHGFVRDRFGNFQTLAASGTNYGNVVRSINDLGLTAGYDTKATF
jgi:hypothetical protein